MFKLRELSGASRSEVEEFEGVGCRGGVEKVTHSTGVRAGCGNEGLHFMRLTAQLTWAAIVMTATVSGHRAQSTVSLRWVTTFERTTSGGPGVYRLVTDGDPVEFVALLSLDVLSGTSLTGLRPASQLIAPAVSQNGKIIPTETTVAFVNPAPPDVLASDESVELRLVVRRADGASFAQGEYSWYLNLGHFFAALRTRAPADSVVVSRTEEMKRIIVRPAVTSAELAETHRARGAEYLAARRYSEALRELEYAVSLNPQDWSAQYSLGMAHSLQQRFAQAIVPLQNAFAGWLKVPERRAGVENALARALLAVGRDAEASAVLRSAGVSADHIPVRIASLRATLAR